MVKTGGALLPPCKVEGQLPLCPPDSQYIGLQRLTIYTRSRTSSAYNNYNKTSNRHLHIITKGDLDSMKLN